MVILQRLRRHMSAQTYQAHKTALISLATQLVIPGVLIIVPIDMCMYVVLTDSTGLQELATDSMFLIGSHSMCQVTVMIMSNSVYRRVLKEKFWKMFRLDILTNQQYGSTVEPSLRTNSFVRHLQN
ncbi:hypothetical protein L5515_002563 [Caenorhabditis briggsae]|uniref:G protein-coupled receptor n=1 Tax=Caenorhabditis briggsae TaxID=6238 RepID=A0AAE9E4E3_CAEBR|nr:hypothetical protein L5515_002563 [Caenorhabditis briggsae]